MRSIESKTQKSPTKKAAKTTPARVTDNLDSGDGRTAVSIPFGGVEIRLSRVAPTRLNTMWKAAGCPSNRDPSQFLRLPATERFVANLARKLDVEKSHICENRQRSRRRRQPPTLTPAERSSPMLTLTLTMKDIRALAEGATLDYEPEPSRPGGRTVSVAVSMDEEEREYLYWQFEVAHAAGAPRDDHEAFLDEVRAAVATARHAARGAAIARAERDGTILPL